MFCLVKNKKSASVWHFSTFNPNEIFITKNWTIPFSVICLYFFHRCNEFSFLLVCLCFFFFNHLLFVLQSPGHLDGVITVGVLMFEARWTEKLSEAICKRRATWKDLIFFPLNFTEEFFIEFRAWTIKESYTFLKNNGLSIYFLLCLSLAKILKTLFWHFWKWLLSAEFCCHISS